MVLLMLILGFLASIICTLVCNFLEDRKEMEKTRRGTEATIARKKEQDEARRRMREVRERQIAEGKFPPDGMSFKEWLESEKTK